MSIFSERLKKIRQSRQELQEQAAKEIGISRAMLSNYERGIQEPSIDTIKKMARHYHVSLNYLLDYSGNIYFTPEDMKDIALYGQIKERTIPLSIKSKEELLRFIELLMIKDRFCENQQNLKELEVLRRNYQQYKHHDDNEDES